MVRGYHECSEDYTADDVDVALSCGTVSTVGGFIVLWIVFST